MQTVSMLHLACHSQPGILVFAPTLPKADQEDEEDIDEEYDDGLLHKEHIHCLRLMAKPTVVLSGSYTAAGAKSVLATMWATQDESSPILMEAWNKELNVAGGSQSQALRAAVLAPQAHDGGKYAHPVHWAGFTLLGNPSK